MPAYQQYIITALKVLLWTIASLLLLITLVVTLIQFPYVQTKLAQAATDYLSRKTETRISIDYVGISFRGTLIAKGILIEDQKRDTLLHTKLLELRFSPGRLKKNHILIRNFNLDQTLININNTEIDSVMNYQFLIDAFTDTIDKPDEEKKATPWKLTVKQASVRNLNVNYHDHFNSELSHLYLTAFEMDEIYADFESFEISGDKVKLDIAEVYSTIKVNDELNDPMQIKNISVLFEDLYHDNIQSRFQLKNLNLNIENWPDIKEFAVNFSMHKNKLSVQQLKAKVDNTELDADFQLGFESLDSLISNPLASRFDLNLRKLHISHHDFKSFLPKSLAREFAGLMDLNTNISGVLHGYANDLHGEGIVFKTAHSTYLRTKFNVKGLTETNKPDFNLQELNLQTNRRDIRLLAGNMIPDNIEIPAFLNANLTANGNPDNARVVAQIHSNLFSGRINASVRNGEYQANLNDLYVELGKLLKDTASFGLLNLDMQLFANGTDINESRAELKTHIKRISYNKHEYRDLSINALLNRQLLTADVAINEDNFALDFSAHANLMKGSEMASFSLNLPHADLQKLGFTEDSLTVKLKADGELKGFSPEDLSGNVLVSNLQISTTDKLWIPGDISMIARQENDELFASLVLPFGDMQVRMNPHNIGELIRAEIQDIRLDEAYRLVDEESDMLKGILSGAFNIREIKKHWFVDGSLKIDDLVWNDNRIGDVSLDVSQQVPDQYNLIAAISGGGNEFSAQGSVKLQDNVPIFDLIAGIDRISMETVEALSAGQIKYSSGYIDGKINVSGTPEQPVFSGFITLNDVVTTPEMLSNPLRLTHERIRFDNNGVYFENFNIRDLNNQTAKIDGTIHIRELKDFRFDLTLNADNFQLFDVKANENPLYYGRLLIDSRIGIQGTMDNPVVDAYVRMNRGSHVSFVVPPSQLNTYQGEDIVLFNNPHIDNTETDQIISRETSIKGLELSSLIEIDRNATLRMFMDPASTDSLVVRGQAALNFNIDRSGNMSMTGEYELREGSYLLTFESIIRKQFELLPGSTIQWRGEPMDAGLNIDAAYTIRTSPYNLMAEELGGLSDIQRRPYLQSWPFQVVLKLRGEILSPEISFEIRMRPEDRNIIGGSVHQKILRLNEDPSALNKQVFSLLLLERFVQDNPLETAGSGTNTMIRSTVSGLLTEQLNRFGPQLIPGFQLNFDLQSYEDFGDGDGEGRTALTMGLSRNLLDERLTVQVGGTVELEGERARNQQFNDIAGDIRVEYRLTKDGRFRLKGFRRNVYETVYEGDVIETGAGVVFTREFNLWRNLFRDRKKQKVQENE